MSLTQQVADAVLASNNLTNAFANFKADQEALLTAARQMSSDMDRTFWVDQVVGSDANDGTQAAPLATLQEAANRSATGGILRIKLVGDYHMSASTNFREGSVVFSGVNGRDATRVTFGGLASNAAGQMARFTSEFLGIAYLFEDVTLVAGTALDATVVVKHMFASHGMMRAIFLRTKFELPVGSDQAVMQLAHGVGFVTQDCVFPAETMAGRWFDAVAAGTLPSAVPQLSYTNVASL